MKRYIILIIIACIVGLFIIKYKSKIEPFQSLVREYCGDCGKRGRYLCSKCVDCGYCITNDGRGECVPGDIKGPYFRDDCYIWEFIQPWLSKYSVKYNKLLSYDPYKYTMGRGKLLGVYPKQYPGMHGFRELKPRRKRRVIYGPTGLRF